VGDFFAGVANFSADFLVGIVEGVWEMVKGLYSIVDLLVHPSRWPAAWETIKQIAVYAWNDPLEFLKMVGSALVDLDTLKENPAKWLGKLVPNILLAIVTGGAGTAATVATRASVMASRFGRLARVADKLNGVARKASKLDKMARGDNLARKVGLVRQLTGKERGALSDRAGLLGEKLSLQKWSGQAFRPVAGR
jgi:hypothetical protein